MSRFKGTQTWQPTAAPAVVTGMPPGPVIHAGPYHAALDPEPAPAAPRVSTMQNPLHKAGFFVVACYVAMLYGFLNELALLLLGVRLFLTYLVGPPALVATLVSGRLRSIFTTRIGYFIVGLYVCFLASVPFSQWRGHSVSMLKDLLITNYSVFFMIAALARTVTHCRRLMYIIAACSIVDFLASFKWGVISGDGRFSFLAGSMSNANDFATHLLVALPFVLLILFEPKRSFIIRGLMIAAAGGLIFAALRTGSRSALLSLVILTLFALWKASFGQRILISGLVLAGLMITPILAPMAAMRLATMFNDAPPATAGQASAMDSHQARMHLLSRSIEVTFQNPLVGAGLGEFMDAEAGVAKQQGERASWRVTHNSYTQVSSEAGIPALICFLGAFFGSLSLNFRLYNRTRKRRDLRHITLPAFHLLLAIVCLAVAMFFASLAYAYYVPLFAGLSVALWNASQNDLREAHA